MWFDYQRTTKKTTIAKDPLLQRKHGIRVNIGNRSAWKSGGENNNNTDDKTVV